MGNETKLEDHRNAVSSTVLDSNTSSTFEDVIMKFLFLCMNMN